MEVGVCVIIIISSSSSSYICRSLPLISVVRYLVFLYFIGVYKFSHHIFNVMFVACYNYLVICK
ncbi:unnamed protein product [Callosobruchus maculatus]|uniref:Uncharacterized protein n=1 Tax=Callosobruchus maculatus TaxID=64391 RepID=A0A653DMK2_CALMS|nr:unnamed protein product [Callosobruchus maculatus]